LLTIDLAPLRTIALAGFCGALIVLSVVDFRTGRLPNRIVLPTLWAGLLLNTTAMAVVPAAQAILGAAAGYLSLHLLRLLARPRYGADCFGGGDLKLAAAIGAWLGVDAVPAVLFVALFSGTTAVLGPLFVGRVQPRQKVPFGPALSAGGVLTLFAGPSLVGWLAL
jgi:leader peptidase (prepilin peptidase)/N-methyltransferase